MKDVSLCLTPYLCLQLFFITGKTKQENVMLVFILISFFFLCILFFLHFLLSFPSPFFHVKQTTTKLLPPLFTICLWELKLLAVPWNFHIYVDIYTDFPYGTCQVFRLWVLKMTHCISANIQTLELWELCLLILCPSYVLHITLV